MCSAHVQCGAVVLANFTSLSKHVFGILIAYSFILLLCAGCWEKSKHV